MSGRQYGKSNSFDRRAIDWVRVYGGRLLSSLHMIEWLVFFSFVSFFGTLIDLDYSGRYVLEAKLGLLDVAGRAALWTFDLPIILFNDDHAISLGPQLYPPAWLGCYSTIVKLRHPAVPPIPHHSRCVLLV
jgi:hypothetical protein